MDRSWREAEGRQDKGKVGDSLKGAARKDGSVRRGALKSTRQREQPEADCVLGKMSSVRAVKRVF